MPTGYPAAGAGIRRRRGLQLEDHDHRAEHPRPSADEALGRRAVGRVLEGRLGEQLGVLLADLVAGLVEELRGHVEGATALAEEAADAAQTVDRPVEGGDEAAAAGVDLAAEGDAALALVAAAEDAGRRELQRLGRGS